MVLQTEVASKEAKGYILNLGFKDSCKGFLKFSDDLPAYKKGQILYVSVKSVQSKVVKCEAIHTGGCV